jgi:hypothetical protein
MVFRSIFSYWSNTTDTPYIQSKLNMFFYINIRIFKIKLNNYISFAITSLNSLKYKQIKIYYNILSFEFLYFKFLMFSVFFYIILIVI